MPTNFRTRPAGGAYIVELALLAPIFFLFLFGIIELARALYLFGTAHEITRAAARLAALSSPAALAEVRQRAIFRDSPGRLALGGAIDDSYVKIDYLAVAADGTQTPITPSCPARNIVNCVNNPHAANCARLVRARLCQPGAAECGTIPYEPLMPLMGALFNGPGGPLLSVPNAVTVVPIQSLGYRPGMSACPP